MKIIDRINALPDMIKQIAVVVLIGIAIVLVGVLVTYQKKEPPAGDVKQQSIPMSADDFTDTPSLQGAVQKQLQAQPENQQPPTNMLQQTADGSRLR